MSRVLATRLREAGERPNSLMNLMGRVPGLPVASRIAEGGGGLVRSLVKQIGGELEI
ncbi:hypothetical protein [Mesorhizobium sp. YM1C-6-2]|uniref:hypothetical protein n=1 Tax=Mesorhizobium sp. YM1C-6-2 TaxID=1827501 RepID=UPI0015FEFEDC|nr:hypothetical protein [Mesorhizobium sp. YM1C-6-2]